MSAFPPQNIWIQEIRSVFPKIHKNSSDFMDFQGSSNDLDRLGFHVRKDSYRQDSLEIFGEGIATVVPLKVLPGTPNNHL